jgi:hypothetical protein
LNEIKPSLLKSGTNNMAPDSDIFFIK